MRTYLSLLGAGGLEVSSLLFFSQRSLLNDGRVRVEPQHGVHVPQRVPLGLPLSHHLAAGTGGTRRQSGNRYRDIRVNGTESSERASKYSSGRYQVT